MPIIKVCQQCSAEFAVPPRRHEQVKFCSAECKTAHGWRTLKCSVCGVEFKRKKSDNAESKTVYCSSACSYSQRKGKKHAVNPDAPIYLRTCEECGVVFRVTRTRSETARFCSVSCKSKSAVFAKECSDREIGEKHWRYQGGKYDDPTAVYGTKKGGAALHRRLMQEHMAAQVPDHPFLEVRKGKLKLRKEIHVHHIDRNPSNNDLSNLLAVTIDAHAKIHHSGAKPHPWECWPSDPKLY